MNRRSAEAAWLALVMLGIIASGGCSSADADRVAVRGQVTVDGEPLARGRIVFAPIGANTGRETGAVIRAGRFEIPRELGPIAGLQRVEIHDEPAVEFELDSPSAVREAGGVMLPPSAIPPRYNVRSELTVELHRATSKDMRFDLVCEQTP